MKKLFLTLVLITLTSILIGCQSNENEDEHEVIERAEGFINSLNEGSYEDAAAQLNDEMADALTPAILAELWQQLTVEFGDFKGHSFEETTEDQGHTIVFLAGEFERTSIRFQLTFDQDQQIAGFFIL
ncbi:Protein of unknown function [Amphibacillus marinus]|uniref:DUF3887 domain-containing protein n=1 Tax=Amphibacillus marinus TaxID=872970 RepID=A0A1H8ITT2_9BACI|nr:DUF3887 domain-containing protein [Amphibacillus marinus]SEN71841.1 Protein of unknown function [Amphibacillus marinus]